MKLPEQFINRMKEDDGIEGLILGCTELPLILSSDNCPVKCFDSVEVHLKKLIKKGYLRNFIQQI